MKVCRSQSPYTHDPPHYGLCSSDKGHAGDHKVKVYVRQPDGSRTTETYGFANRKEKA